MDITFPQELLKLSLMDRKQHLTLVKVVSQNIEWSESLEIFRHKSHIWMPDNCKWRLCKT